MLGHVKEEPPPRSRFGRLLQAADRRHVPLLTILVTVGVVAATYLAGTLIYRIKEIILLIVVAGFIALLLNPIVVLVQRRLVPRRGIAVAIVTLWATLVFIGLAVAFGYPLVNGITHLADSLPTYVANAQHGRGWIGHLVTRYHIQSWVQRNTPKLVSYAQSLSKPALSIGAGALSLVIELLTIFFLVLLLLIEAPKMRAWITEPDEAGPGGQGHRGGGRGEPGRGRVHAGQPADLAHRRNRGVRDADGPRRPVPAAVGAVGRPGGFPPDDRRGPGRHPHRPVRLHPFPDARASSPRSSSSPTSRSRTTS